MRTLSNSIREPNKNNNIVNANAFLVYILFKYKTCFLLDISSEIIANRNKRTWSVCFASRLLEKRLFRSITQTVAQHIQIGRKFYVIQSYCMGPAS